MDIAPVNAAPGLLVGTVAVRPVPPRLSRKQSAVLAFCEAHGRITLAEAVALIGSNLYANRGKHVGATLAILVRRGLLVRERPGVFRLPGAHHGGPAR